MHIRREQCSNTSELEGGRHVAADLPELEEALVKFWWHFQGLPSEGQLAVHADCQELSQAISLSPPGSEDLQPQHPVGGSGQEKSTSLGEMAGLTSPGASTWAGLRADSGLSVCEKFTRPVSPSTGWASR